MHDKPNEDNDELIKKNLKNYQKRLEDANAKMKKL